MGGWGLGFHDDSTVVIVIEQSDKNVRMGVKNCQKLRDVSIDNPLSKSKS